MSSRVFESYIQSRFALAGAALPHEKLAVIEQLENELHGRGTENGKGIIPLDIDGDGIPDMCEFDVTHAVYHALLQGETLAIGSTPVKKTGGMQDKKMQGIVFVVVSVLLIGGFLWWTWLRPRRVVTAIETAATPTATHTPEPSRTPTPTPEPTATAEPVVDAAGSVSLSAADPVSVEVAGEIYLVSLGNVGSDGAWHPKKGSAEWLQSTTIRRVFAVPLSERLAETVLSGDVPPIIVRLRNGDAVIYDKQVTAHAVRRDQIEWLIGRSPSVVVVLHGPEGDRRIVVTGVWNGVPGPQKQDE